MTGAQTSISRTSASKSSKKHSHSCANIDFAHYCAIAKGHFEGGEFKNIIKKYSMKFWFLEKNVNDKIVSRELMKLNAK
jgi:hypothetical protein